MPKKVPDIEKKIIEYLKKVEWPSTTEDVAKAIGVSWQTAQINLLKLAAQGIVKYRKVGRQNQFWLSDKYRREFGD